MSEYYDDRIRDAVLAAVAEEFGGTYGGGEIADRVVAELRPVFANVYIKHFETDQFGHVIPNREDSEPQGQHSTPTDEKRR